MSSTTMNENVEIPPNPTEEAEGGAIGGAAPTSKKADPVFKRNMMIVAGVFGVAFFLILLAFFARSGGKDANAQAQVNVGTADQLHTRSKDDEESLSPNMKEAIKKKLDQERKAAGAGGQDVWMAPEVLESVQPIVKPEKQTTPQVGGPAAALDGSHPGATGGSSAGSGPSQEDIDRNARRRAGLERQMGAMLSMMSSSNNAGVAPARVNFDANKVAAAANGATGAATQAGASNAASVGVAGAAQAGSAVVFNNQNQLVGALEIVPAEVASPIDSYKTPFASARIVGGKLNGAYLVGSIKQQEDGLQIVYNQMRIGNQAYAIDAIALDEATSTNAMNANVDRRYLERWVLPVGAAMLGGYATASSRTGSTTVVSGTTGSAGVEVASPPPTSEQARAAGYAAGMAIISREVEKAAAKPYQITMPANVPIGILFRAPVTRVAN